MSMTYQRPAFTQRVLDRMTSTLDAQTAKGIAEYGMTLDENKSWRNLPALIEELIDATQYASNEIERQEAQEASIRETIVDLNVLRALTRQSDEADELLRKAIERLRGLLPEGA